MTSDENQIPEASKEQLADESVSQPLPEEDKSTEMPILDPWGTETEEDATPLPVLQIPAPQNSTETPEVPVVVSLPVETDTETTEVPVLNTDNVENQTQTIEMPVLNTDKEENKTETPDVPVLNTDKEENQTQTPDVPVLNSDKKESTGQETEVSLEPTATELALLSQRVIELQRYKKELKEEITKLQASRDELLQLQAETQAALGRLVKEGLSELEQRKQALQITVEQLERRQERIRQEMRTTFAGVSQDLAIRVQGFKDYLVGSLQDLASSAEQLELVPPTQSSPASSSGKESKEDRRSSGPKFAEQSFQDQAKQIRRILDQYRSSPDYYGPPWQLRRTFEPIHAERVSNWFFTQGGRGALRSMGSRLQNILIGSSIISVLRQIYGNRLRTLVLANSPERLGEWRRGLQDCLGITRTDFGPERGVVLFEAADALTQKADRLVKEGQMPLIIIDETEELINLSLLQFPLWIAFAAEPQLQTQMRDY